MRRKEAKLTMAKQRVKRKFSIRRTGMSVKRSGKGEKRHQRKRRRDQITKKTKIERANWRNG